MTSLSLLHDTVTHLVHQMLVNASQNNASLGHQSKPLVLYPGYYAGEYT